MSPARTSLAKPSGTAARVRRPLELDLLGDRHVVAEDEGRESEAERLERLGRRVAAGGRDDREARALDLRERARAARLAVARGGRRGAGAERLLGGGEGVAGRILGRVDRDDEVVGARGARLVREQAGALEHVLVRRGRHDQARRAHARPRPEVRRDPHEHHRVEVRAGPDEAANGHGAGLYDRPARGSWSRPAKTGAPHPAWTANDTPQSARHAPATLPLGIPRAARRGAEWIC
jgi:hypothetical protein